MKTTSFSLIYQVTQKEIFPPATKELERKDKWLDEVKRNVEADYKPLLVKVTYELFNPEVEQLRKFFHIVVFYYAVQNKDMLEGVPDWRVLRDYREEILDEMLGFDMKTANKVIHSRKSTADFKTVQAWMTLLKEVEEDLFDASGYEFPDSKEFWELAKEHGFDRAKTASIERLQAKLKRKSS